MINDLKKDCETRMRKSAESLDQAFTRVRTGRAHPAILKDIMVPYYGADTPLTQLANVGGVEVEATEWVEPMRVESGRDQQQLRPEGVDCW